MRILVTGHDGQVAQALAEQAQGHELVFTAYPEFDLSKPETIEAAVARIQPELIVSAAAYTAVDKAESEPELAMAINGDGPGVLARAGAEIGAPIIHLSTDYVFDGSLDRPWREEDPTGPLGVYGATKLAGEQAVQASGATHAVLRLAWVYSPFGNNFVKTMLRLAETRDALNVVEDQRGCPGSALDIATAILTVVEHWQREGATSGLYHFTGSGETTWADFARAIFAESAKHGGPTAEVTGIPTSGYPTPAKRPANSRLDCTRFAETFGYRAPAWQESLAVVVDRLFAAGRPA
ncbi:dTDP-4-dehydrorhamnose reductase [Sphingomonas sp. ABOLD]|uniref:dTDP-4-dehydrorhamnose reductase n=1 Tax=Sphingomonas trueperi TaxID=53317 RepID=A0A7X5XYT5_9SPHN|nr:MULTISPECIES: dTDP-4-dehydrorhamnose reductase [Sphingomonas]NJB96605.1 dTDP-4-dehydrorhamnose reductase [Sphingomonas trueperi]RSV40119.1 dTDP-4-dehydrorhamnose reductase [Sphingomonas sp. ABOLE]RSV46692.1 dTDP-4-dehydrorhamnose reductase [Sphingomonas sp. ABOLD]